MDTLCPSSWNCSIGHIALGFGAGALGVQSATTAIFLGYEVMRNKPAERKLQAIGEYSIGLIIQKLTQ